MKHYEYEINLYVENELPPDKTQEVLLHISNCAKCKKILEDYTSIKNNVVCFYKALPLYKNEVRFPLAKKDKLSLRTVTQKIFIPTAVSASIILAILLWIKPGNNLQNINSAPSIKKGSAVISKNSVESYLYPNNKHKIVHSKKTKQKHELINDAGILVSNKIIGRAIALNAKDSITEELCNVGKSYQQQEFNEVINSVLYSNYSN